MKPIFPNIDLCTDNAAMIAIVGLKKYKKKILANYPSMLSLDGLLILMLNF